MSFSCYFYALLLDWSQYIRELLLVEIADICEMSDNLGGEFHFLEKIIKSFATEIYIINSKNVNFCRGWTI